jgi:transcriptional regulator with XRE-family HTH domain
MFPLVIAGNSQYELQSIGQTDDVKGRNLRNVKNTIDTRLERAAFAERAQSAFWRATAKRRGLSQTELGRAVGARVGRLYKQPTVADWLSGSLPRDVASMIALAQELGVDPGWLYFGEASKAPAPGDVPATQAARQGTAMLQDAPKELFVRLDTPDGLAKAKAQLAAAEVAQKERAEQEADEQKNKKKRG